MTTFHDIEHAQAWVSSHADADVCVLAGQAHYFNGERHVSGPYLVRFTLIPYVHVICQETGDSEIAYEYRPLIIA